MKEKEDSLINTTLKEDSWINTTFTEYLSMLMWKKGLDNSESNSEFPRETYPLKIKKDN